MQTRTDRKRVRLVNETGVARDWKITDLATDEPIPMVQNVVITGLVDDVVTAEVRTVIPAVDVTAEARIRGACPYCGHEPEAQG